MPESNIEMSDEEMDRRFKAAVQAEFQKRRDLGLPVAKYDYDAKKVYLLYPDGRKEYR